MGLLMSYGRDKSLVKSRQATAYMLMVLQVEIEAEHEKVEKIVASEVNYFGIFSKQLARNTFSICSGRPQLGSCLILPSTVRSSFKNASLLQSDGSQKLNHKCNS